MAHYKKKSGKVILMNRDFEILQFLLESKIVTRDQIKLYFFKGSSNSNVNRRLNKILSLDLIRGIPLDIGQKTVYGYSITLKGLNRVKHLLFYECEKVHQSDCPIHDTILVDIRIYDEKASYKPYQ